MDAGLNSPSSGLLGSSFSALLFPASLDFIFTYKSKQLNNTFVSILKINDL